MKLKFGVQEHFITGSPTQLLMRDKENPHSDRKQTNVLMALTHTNIVLRRDYALL